MRGGGVFDTPWNGMGIDFARLSTDVIQLPEPEPETFALFGLGLAGLGLAARCRRRIAV